MTATNSPAYTAELNTPLYNKPLVGGGTVDTALRIVDIAAYSGHIDNGHNESLVSVANVGDGFYEITWTGSGGNANDTGAEQLHLLFEVVDASGTVVDTSSGSHGITWTLENDPAEWSGANSVIVGAGIICSTGSTFASPGDDIAGSYTTGFLSTSPSRNNSAHTAQSTTGSLVEKIVGSWLPDVGQVTNERGPIIYSAYNTSGAVVDRNDTTGDTASMATANLITLGLSLGNDNSLTSGAVFTERVRLKALATPLA